MKGTHKVVIQAKRIRFTFTLRRNLTIVRGDSATGKTTLVDMVQQHMDNPTGSPVEITCDKKCCALAGALWKDTLSGIHDSIVFIDEGNEFVETPDFARTIAATDNYYVIVTRESLPTLPYSVEEIYGIHYTGKYGQLQQVYNEFYRIYGDYHSLEKVKVTKVITEDSGSGFDFFNDIYGKQGIVCKPANGKSNMFSVASRENGELLLIADGAAFGPEMDRMDELMKRNQKIHLYLPESFEWLILEAGVFSDNGLTEMLQDPAKYIECGVYFSWERFFTDYLVTISHGGYLQYSKKQLNPNYLHESIKDKILQAIPEALSGNTEIRSANNKG